MIKKIAVINDLSGFGKCSLTAAISVISAMGVQPCPLPTAILSAQTGYPSYYYDDYTDKMENICQEWEKMNVTFDGIYTGFMAGKAQIERVFQFLDTFQKRDTFLLTDPIMGDNGKVFSFFTEELCDQMRELAFRADMITPNLTELCLLAGVDYQHVVGLKHECEMMKYIEQVAVKLIEKGPKTIVVTGIQFIDEINGTRKMGNLAVEKEQAKLVAFPYANGSYSGTGDLFASVMAAGMAKGNHIEDSMKLAGDFIGKAITDSVEEKIPRNDGVNYEKFLGMLTNQNAMSKFSIG